MTTTKNDQPAQHTKPVTEATITEGKASAPKIMGKVPVRWELDTATGHVTSNGEHVGRVVESIPGKLYYFQNLRDAAKSDYWGMFGTAHGAAEQGAVRAELDR